MNSFCYSNEKKSFLTLKRLKSQKIIFTLTEDLILLQDLLEGACQTTLHLLTVHVFCLLALGVGTFLKGLLRQGLQFPGGLYH
jgi:hypothetical protein